MRRYDEMQKTSLLLDSAAAGTPEYAMDPLLGQAATDLAELLAFVKKVREIYDGPDSTEEAMDRIGNTLWNLENP